MEKSDGVAEINVVVVLKNCLRSKYLHRRGYA